MSRSFEVKNGNSTPRTHPHESSFDKEQQQLKREQRLEPTAKAARAKHKTRPVGRVREVFDLDSKLPRRQQEHIVNWVSAYVSHYEQTRQS